MLFNSELLTDIGQKRQQNQDAGAIHPELGLFLVADGMGGHQGGETASTMAAEIVPISVKNAQKVKSWNPKKVISKAICKANMDIHERAKHDLNLQGMGTTTTALLFKDKKLTIGHVGDSRCYFIRPHAIWQMTRDHSLVQEKLKAGLITREQLKTDKMRNVITRSVGFESELHVDVYEMTIQCGDVFLICSDGLSGMQNEKNILKIVQENLFEHKNIKKAAKELIHAANTSGGDDNITVVLIEVLETG